MKSTIKLKSSVCILSFNGREKRGTFDVTNLSKKDSVLLEKDQINWENDPQSNEFKLKK